MFLRILVVACFALSVAQAQDIQYVFAENGLVIREQPNQGATKVGILDYGTAVEIIEHTQLNLDVKDNNKKVSGQWVKIKGPAAGEYFEEGYVFNGYLTEDKIERPLKVSFDAFTIFIDALDADAELKTSISQDITSLEFKIKDGKSPENRYLKVKHHQEYRSIKVFQRYRNSIAVNSKEGKTQLTEFQHYTSSWRPLQQLPSSGNIFKTKQFSKKDYSRFGAVDKAELKAYLGTQEDVEFDIVPSQIELKFIMTDADGHKIEKIINFELPLKA